MEEGIHVISTPMFGRRIIKTVDAWFFLILLSWDIFVFYASYCCVGKRLNLYFGCLVLQYCYLCFVLG
jgi:hypothetical protein